ncbi:hypothetical protein G3T14_10985 [Methylobacterium sp. BTF04]|uniref:hypothetical protein n=1 Tax=Methylobacterium sp. BTF04 TaxID=2708300 RepID=UPI0013CFDCA0|nr:hypothetical protein [Methylobacterium sp. BTF04]NEU12661.1 hypothetical protein [Methylobacterium sp. BTF04]
MKTIIPAMTLVAALALPDLAAAQQSTSPQGAGVAPGFTDPATPPRSQNLRRGEVMSRTDVPPEAQPPGAGRPPRSEAAIGPDLMYYVFAPIGGMVGPITEGIHRFDAAIAPISEALQPIVGPLDLPPPEPAITPEPAVTHALRPRK